jgi:hypothetical protein
MRNIETFCNTNRFSTVPFLSHPLPLPCFHTLSANPSPPPSHPYRQAHLSVMLRSPHNTPTHRLLYTTPRCHELLRWELHSSKQIKIASKTKELRQQVFYTVLFNWIKIRVILSSNTQPNTEKHWIKIPQSPRSTPQLIIVWQKREYYYHNYTFFIP